MEEWTDEGYWIIESRVVVNSTRNALRTDVLFTDELKYIFF